MNTTNRLSNMNIKEISGVTKGANRKQWLICKGEGEDDMGEKVLKTADIIQVAVEALGMAILKTLEDHDTGEITKLEEDMTTSFDQFVEFIKGNTGASFKENIRAKDLRSHMWEATDALFDAVGNTMGDPDMDAAAKKAKISQDVEDFAAWVKDMLDIDEVNKSGAAISSDRLKRLKDMHASLGALIAEGDNAAPAGGTITKGDDTKMTPEEITKMVTDAMEPVVTRLAALEKGEGGATDATPADDVTKIAEAVTKAMEPLVARLEVVEKAKGIKKSLDDKDEGNQETVKKSMWEGLL